MKKTRKTKEIKKSTKLLIPALALTIFTISGAVAIENASAHGFGGGEGRDSFIQALSEKFNLNEDDVDSFLEEQRDARQEERQSEREEQLNQLVSEGKLTEDQKNALITKMEENQAEREANREDFQNMTREERQAERQEHREEMDAWFESQGIDKDVLGEFGKGPGGHGGHGGRGMGNR